jgi:hypothetical protein
MTGITWSPQGNKGYCPRGIFDNVVFLSVAKNLAFSAQDKLREESYFSPLAKDPSLRSG